EAPGMASSIREGNIANLQNIMLAGQNRGMRLMDDALLELVRDGKVDTEDAYLLAEDKDGFRAKTRPS
ncbi:MAG TPA: hypothetical protein VJB59_02505, partial [Bdellovibrionota bacterium]|nr:hypothetical protein [Bdellovibrionota bacterium]